MRGRNRSEKRDLIECAGHGNSAHWWVFPRMVSPIFVVLAVIWLLSRRLNSIMKTMTCSDPQKILKLRILSQLNFLAIAVEIAGSDGC
jgi:hypothetical protein